MKKKLIAPIWIKSDLQEINICNDVILRKITEKESLRIFCRTAEYNIDWLISKVSELWTLNDYYDSYEHVLVWPELTSIYWREIIFSPSWFVLEAEKEYIIYILKTLRIVNNGNFYCPFAFNMDEKEIHFLERFTIIDMRIDFLIQKKDLPNIKLIFQKVKDNDNDIRVERFIRNQDNAINDKIRFIEAISIIESIIVWNTNSEISFRFALYLSYLFKKLDFKKAKKFYNIRSRLTHEWESQDFNKQMLKEILDISREIIQKYLLDDLSHENILNSINYKIAN